MITFVIWFGFGFNLVNSNLTTLELICPILNSIRLVKKYKNKAKVFQKNTDKDYYKEIAA